MVPFTKARGYIMHLCIFQGDGSARRSVFPTEEHDACSCYTEGARYGSNRGRRNNAGFALAAAPHDLEENQSNETNEPDNPP